MKAVIGLTLLLAVGFSLADDVKSYKSYQLWRVVPNSDDQVDALKRLEEKFTEVDFWTEPVIGRSVDITIPPTLLDYARVLLMKVNLPAETIHKDLQQLINKNRASEPVALRSEFNYIKTDIEGFAVPSSVSYDIVNTFPRHTNVLNWLQEMAASFPGLASIEDIGRTYEGRTQRMIKIGAPSRGSEKPIIWVDSAIHSREWLTVGTTIWIINKMLTTYNTDPEVKALMDYYDWYFLPVSNPDGYEYTHTNDRLWRKTRTPNAGSSCRGTDPNRNWDYKWMVSGTSTNPCSQTYGGSAAFSEPITQNMRDAILRVASRIRMYMNVHSYSQMWLMPWAWGGPRPSDYPELERVAGRGNAALRRVHGKSFILGPPPEILYAASGGAYDWAKAVAGIKHSYCFELRPDGNAWNGFVVSESVIQPSGEEVWAALASVANDLK